MDETTIEIPAEYADKGFLASVKTEDGKISVTKLLKKVENQESLLGKRALPTRDSTETELDDFISKMSGNFHEEDYNEVLSGLDTISAAELKSALKASGVAPRQAKRIVEAHNKLVDKKYSADEFVKLVTDNVKTQERLDLAKKVLGDEYETIKKMSNEDAVRLIVAAANIGEKYNVKEGTTGAGIQTTNPPQETGFCQGYVDEMREIAKRGGTQAEKDECMKRWKVLD